MKKWLLALLCVLMVMGFAVAEEEIVYTTGGGEMHTAFEIKENVLYQRKNGPADAYDSWYCFEAPVDGECYLACYANPQDFGVFELYNEKGTYLGTHEADYKNFECAPFEVTKGQTYYFKLWSGTQKRFSICFTDHHVPGELKLVENATCAAEGLMEARCTLCETVCQTQILPKVEHVPGEMTTVLEPTCLQQGLKTIQCINCGLELESESIDLVDHVLGEMTIIAPATCIDDGYAEQRCTVCNVQLADEILPAFGHSSAAWEDELAASCVTDGERVQKCSLCAEILKRETIAAYGHGANELETVREAGCNQSGLKLSCCIRCGVELQSEEIPALGHSYTEWEILQEASKQQEGEQRRHCIHCGDTQFEKIPKLEKFMGLF